MKELKMLERRCWTASAGSDVVQSGRPLFDDFFQHLWPYIGNNTANVVFQMVKRLWLIRIDQGWRTNGTRANDGTQQNILGTPSIKNDLHFSLK
ncbi:hypothetical protein TNCV_3346151 [Trichonephila clavipes]|nr:hypothetical protein TNCV_3346151 [Trichonephila clavipes]